MISHSGKTIATAPRAKSLWQHVVSALSLLVFVLFLLMSGGFFDGVLGQRSGVRQGTATFQRVASTVDLDERDDKLYRRPPTYLIIASKIVRPSTVYKVYLFSIECDIITPLIANFLLFQYRIILVLGCRKLT